MSILMYKILNRQAPSYLSDLLENQLTVDCNYRIEIKFHTLTHLPSDSLPAHSLTDLDPLTNSFPH